MSHFFEESAAETPAASREAAPFEDWVALPDETRREVREFIAFKRMQADKTRSDGDDGDGDD